MNEYVRTPLHDALGADSPSDYLDDTLSLAHLLLMAAETLNGQDGRAVYQGVCTVHDRLKLLASAMGVKAVL